VDRGKAMKKGTQVVVHGSYGFIVEARKKEILVSFFGGKLQLYPIECVEIA